MSFNNDYFDLYYHGRRNYAGGEDFAEEGPLLLDVNSWNPNGGGQVVSPMRRAEWYKDNQWRDKGYDRDDIAFSHMMWARQKRPGYWLGDDFYGSNYEVQWQEKTLATQTFKIKPCVGGNVVFHNVAPIGNRDTYPLWVSATEGGVAWWQRSSFTQPPLPQKDLKISAGSLLFDIPDSVSEGINPYRPCNFQAGVENEFVIEYNMRTWHILDDNKYLASNDIKRPDLEMPILQVIYLNGELLYCGVAHRAVEGSYNGYFPTRDLYWETVPGFSVDKPVRLEGSTTESLDAFNNVHNPIGKSKWWDHKLILNDYPVNGPEGSNPWKTTPPAIHGDVFDEFPTTKLDDPASMNVTLHGNSRDYVSTPRLRTGYTAYPDRWMIDEFIFLSGNRTHVVETGGFPNWRYTLDYTGLSTGLAGCTSMSPSTSYQGYGLRSCTITSTNLSLPGNPSSSSPVYCLKEVPSWDPSDPGRTQGKIYWLFQETLPAHEAAFKTHFFADDISDFTINR